MATAPQPLPPLPAARRRASAVRRFPPGCGRQHRNAAPPPRRPVSTPYSANGDRPPNPSACAAAKTSSTPAAARFPRIEGHNRSGADGPLAGTKTPAAAEVVARRLSAVRRYPPGCGRGGVAVPKPEASVVTREGEAGAIDLLAAVCEVEAKAVHGDQELVPSVSTLCNGDANSDGAGKSGGDGGGAMEACGSPGPSTPPYTVTGITLAPLLPWAEHGQRSLQRRRTF